MSNIRQCLTLRQFTLKDSDFTSLSAFKCACIKEVLVDTVNAKKKKKKDAGHSQTHYSVK